MHRKVRPQKDRHHQKNRITQRTLICQIDQRIPQPLPTAVITHLHPQKIHIRLRTVRPLQRRNQLLCTRPDDRRIHAKLVQDAIVETEQKLTPRR